MEMSSRRVTAHTVPAVNEAIRRRAWERLAFYAKHPERVPERLRELDREWDIERCLETGSSTLSLTGLMLFTLTRKRRWFLLSAAVQGFFLQHALQGWCPPLPLLRRLGVRTQEEIEEERRGLSELARGLCRSDGV